MIVRQVAIRIRKAAQSVLNAVKAHRPTAKFRAQSAKIASPARFRPATMVHSRPARIVFQENIKEKAARQIARFVVSLLGFSHIYISPSYFVLLSKIPLKLLFDYILSRQECKLGTESSL